MFGLASGARCSSDQNVFLGVATVADREDLSAFGIHDYHGASRFEVNRTFDFDHSQIVLSEKEMKVDIHPLINRTTLKSATKYIVTAFSPEKCAKPNRHGKSYAL
jgi:hypothetical protein